MGRHRKHHDDDQTLLLPDTVEELAARERVEGSWRKGPVIILLTISLLITGAAAWALSGSPDAPPLVLPSLSPSQFSEEFQDGFGIGSPSPSPSPSPSTSPTVTVSVTASPSPQDVVKSAPSTVASPAVPTGLVFSYQVYDYGNSWQIRAEIKNLGPEPLDWAVLMTIAGQMDMTNSWNATFAGDNELTITRPSWLNGPLKPGDRLGFGFEGDKPASKQAKVLSCTVNGINCDTIKP